MTGSLRIEGALRQALARGRLGFIPFITAGDPDLAGTRRLASALAEAGADVLELGVPWSDPLADGPIIQQATQRALTAGTTLERILEELPAIHEAARLPVVLFTYFNPILRFGIDRFASAAERAGVDGLLVTDLPPEEADELCEALGPRGLATVFLAAPTSTERRLEVVARASSGFIYAVSRTGVTGTQWPLPEGLRSLVGRIRRHSTLPVAVGFGISAPEHVVALRGYTDAFVVGSAIVEQIGRLGAGDAGVRAVTTLARELVQAGS